ncbi:Trk system potassium transporter TrkA [bacterium]|nr:Trk system potassium transporter TrkA [bacterium]
MRIVIIGAGEVGAYLARYLVAENHDISLIDNNAERVQHINDHLDIETLLGSGTSVDDLSKVEVGSADLLLAISNNDEVNMLACLFGRKLGVKSAVARIDNPDVITGHPLFYREHLGIDMIINPPMLTASEATALITPGAGSGIAEFGYGRLYLRPFEVEPGSPFTRRPIKELRMPGALVAALIRNGEVMIPSGEDVIQDSDRIFVICRREAIPYVQKGVGEHKDAIKHIVIVGGGKIGAAIAHYFDVPRYRVKLFEDDRRRAWELTEELTHVKVIDNDGGDIDVLREEYLEATDAFVACTGSDEKNIMTALMAKENGVERNIAIVDKPQFAEIGPKLGLTASLAPRILAAAQVLRFTRGGRVNSVSLLHEGQAEVIEFVAGHNSRLINTPLMNLKLPKGILIGAIINGNRAVIPGGQDVITPGDSVVMLALHDRIAYVENLLRFEDVVEGDAPLDMEGAE